MDLSKPIEQKEKKKQKRKVVENSHEENRKLENEKTNKKKKDHKNRRKDNKIEPETTNENSKGQVDGPNENECIAEKQQTTNLEENNSKEVSSTTNDSSNVKLDRYGWFLSDKPISKEEEKLTKKEAEKECVPDELGLPEGKFFVAVVGNRLDPEIDEAFLNIMKQIMDAAENVDFAVIGDAEKLQEKLADTSYGKRIHFLGYCMDLPGTYRALHLYLNPRRLGGGWSSAMALMAGLPVVTLPACDVAYNVGGEFTVTTEEEMVDAV